MAVLKGATLLLTLGISVAKLRGSLAALVLVLGLVVAAISVVLGEDKTSYVIAAAIGGAPVAIVCGVRGHLEVTVRNVFALSVYLLIGLFFSSRSAWWRQSIQGPSSPGIDGPIADHLYFSCSTLTTIGFGDLTASEDIRRMRSALEALIGQLYLITVIACWSGTTEETKAEGN